MEHILSITSDQRSVLLATAETNLGDFPLVFHPDSVEGRLLEVGTADLLNLKFGERVIVGVSGKRYKFEELRSDGSFKLRKESGKAR